MRDILWQGEPLLKEVRHYAHCPVCANVIPLVVYQDGKDVWGQPEKQMGLVLQCNPLELLPSSSKEDDSLVPFEIGSPSVLCDPIRWWRAAQFLVDIPVITHQTDEFQWYSAAGRPEKEDFEYSSVQEVRTLLSDAVYGEIMARPVPGSILQWVIKQIDDGDDLYLARWQITDEIQAGTVRWSQELKRIRVQHPDERRAMNEAMRVVTLRYGPSLCSYAAFRKLSYNLHADKEKAFLMNTIEWALYHSVEKGIERDYGKPIAILVATLVAELASDQSMQNLAAKHPDDEGVQYQLRFHPSSEERFAQLQRWCAQRGMGTPRVVWEDVFPMLQRLYTVWNQLPVVCPLID